MREQFVSHGQLAPAREPGDLTPKPHVQPARRTHRRPAAGAVKRSILDNGRADASAEPDPVPGADTDRPGRQLLGLPQLRIPLRLPPHIGDVVEHRFCGRPDADAVLNNVARPATGTGHHYPPWLMTGAVSRSYHAVASHMPATGNARVPTTTGQSHPCHSRRTRQGPMSRRNRWKARILSLAGVAGTTQAGAPRARPRPRCRVPKLGRMS